MTKDQWLAVRHKCGYDAALGFDVEVKYRPGFFASPDYGTKGRLTAWDDSGVTLDGHYEQIGRHRIKIPLKRLSYKSIRSFRILCSDA